MKELSLHILDLVENSLKAEAELIKVTITEDTVKDILIIEIEDNGKGMEKDFLERVDDPFTTTRKTRKVGLGLSLMKAAALRCEGSFNIFSEKNKGTRVYCTFKHSHIDRAPLGNMGQTITAIINQCTHTDLVYTHIYNDKCFILDTKEISGIIDGISINSTKILLWICNYVNNNINNLYKYNIML